LTFSCFIRFIIVFIGIEDAFTASDNRFGFQLFSRLKSGKVLSE
jgi:hypothetical protein